MIRISDDPFAHRLICPRCRGDYLHHGAVTVYDRREDDRWVTLVEVRDKIANPDVIDNKDSGNPSLRRDGLVIEFRCEGCDSGLELTIAQHKGQSFIAWRGANGHTDHRA